MGEGQKSCSTSCNVQDGSLKCHQSKGPEILLDRKRNLISKEKSPGRNLVNQVAFGISTTLEQILKSLNCFHSHLCSQFSFCALCFMICCPCLSACSGLINSYVDFTRAVLHHISHTYSPRGPQMRQSACPGSLLSEPGGVKAAGRMPSPGTPVILNG